MRQVASRIATSSQSMVNSSTTQRERFPYWPNTWKEDHCWNCCSLSELCLKAWSDKLWTNCWRSCPSFTKSLGWTSEVCRLHRSCSRKKGALNSVWDFTTIFQTWTRPTSTISNPTIKQSIELDNYILAYSILTLPSTSLWRTLLNGHWTSSLRYLTTFSRSALFCSNVPLGVSRILNRRTSCMMRWSIYFQSLGKRKLRGRTYAAWYTHKQFWLT